MSAPQVLLSEGGPCKFTPKLLKGLNNSPAPLRESPVKKSLILQTPGWLSP